MSKAIADISPRWYLMHHRVEEYIGPFADRYEAADYRVKAGAYAVVRTSKVHPEAEKPSYYLVLRNDTVGPFTSAKGAALFRFRNPEALNDHRVTMWPVRIPARKPWTVTGLPF